jgi:hypothetical protein
MSRPSADEGFMIGVSPGAFFFKRGKGLIDFTLLRDISFDGFECLERSGELFFSFCFHGCFLSGVM